jgi:hypothetical protein
VSLSARSSPGRAVRFSSNPFDHSPKPLDRVHDDSPGAGRDAGETHRTQQSQGQIPRGGQELGSVPAPHAAGVLAQRDVADVMQAVLDPPVAPVELQEAGRVGLLGLEAGDPIGHLDGVLIALPTFARDLVDLPHVLPEGSQIRRQFRGRDHRAPFASAVPLGDGRRAGAGRLTPAPFIGGNRPRPGRRWPRCRGARSVDSP